MSTLRPVQASGTRNAGSQMKGRSPMKVVGGSVSKSRKRVGAESCACTTTFSRITTPAQFHHRATRTGHARRTKQA